MLGSLLTPFGKAVLLFVLKNRSCDALVGLVLRVSSDKWMKRPVSDNKSPARSKDLSKGSLQET